MLVLGGPSTPATYGVDLADCLGNNFGMLDDFGQSTEIINYFETDNFRFLCELSRDWFLSGYLSADAATTTDWGTVLVKAGNCFGYFTRIKPNADVEVKSQTGYEVYTIPVSDTVVTLPSVERNGLYAGQCLLKTEGPAFYNWAFASQEFEDLINWGVKGVDWVENEEGLATYPEGVDVTTVSYNDWFYPTSLPATPEEGNGPEFGSSIKNIHASLLPRRLMVLTLKTRKGSDFCNAFTSQEERPLWGSKDTRKGLMG